MNILHIIAGPGSGGAEIYVKDLAKYLVSQGHSLHIAFVGSAKELNEDLEFERQFLEELRLARVKICFIGNTSRKLPWKGIYKIRNYIKNNDIDICHTHLAYGIVFSIFSKAPVVYTHHQYEARWPINVYRCFNLIVDEYIGISQKCALALKRYTDGRNVTTIFNAVSMEKFRDYTRKRDFQAGRKINIVMVGRIMPQKDYHLMINAISIIPKDILRKIHISIAGVGSIEYKKELEKVIMLKGLNDNISFFGSVVNIPRFLFKGDLFLMTSEYEGLPIALTEAAISGLPCIVTDVGGCSEIIQKSNNGIVVPPNNPEAIAKAIIKLIESPTLMEKYSSNAIDSSYQYTINNAGESHIKLYSSLIK